MCYFPYFYEYELIKACVVTHITKHEHKYLMLWRKELFYLHILLIILKNKYDHEIL